MLYANVQMRINNVEKVTVSTRSVTLFLQLVYCKFIATVEQHTALFLHRLVAHHSIEPVLSDAAQLVHCNVLIDYAERICARTLYGKRLCPEILHSVPPPGLLRVGWSNTLLCSSLDLLRIR
jgi:hypothetical protein